MIFNILIKNKGAQKNETNHKAKIEGSRQH